MLFGVIFIFNDFRAKHSEIQSKVLWRENELIQFFEVCIYVVVCMVHDTDVGYKNYVMKYDFWIEKYKIGPISATELIL